MRKVLLILILFFIGSFSFAFNQQYFNSLPSWDKHNIQIVNDATKATVSVIWYAPAYKRIYKYIDLWDGFYVKIPDKFKKVGYRPAVEWTAFFISSNGILVTNHHVISDPNLIYKIVYNGKEYPVKVLAYSPKYDLALLYVKWNNFPYLKLWNSDNLMLGQSVFAIWNTLGEYPNTVTFWIISWLHRHIFAGGDFGSESLEDVIQTSAAISFWNSWWPLIDSLWNVIWINTAVNLRGQNLGFAVPVNTLKKWLYSLVRAKR